MYDVKLRRFAAEMGFSLIEVLIAMCLLGIALLAIEKMEMVGFRYNQHAFLQSVASFQLESILVDLRVRGGEGKSEWDRDNSRLLPGGVGEVAKVGEVWRVQLRWHSPLSHGWRCDGVSQKGYACLELYGDG